MLEDTGAVDEHVDAAEGLDRLPDGAARVEGVAQVDGDEDGCRALGGGATVEHCDPGAVVEEAAHDRCADAAGAAGHDDALRHGSPFARRRVASSVTVRPRSNAPATRAFPRRNAHPASIAHTSAASTSSRASVPRARHASRSNTKARSTSST